jgi:60 kDa SS-A/Ro ribonucleoprotein
MAKNIKKLAQDKEKRKTIPSHTKVASVNRAGGVSFDIEDVADSATKLVTMTGGSFFSEPKYYSFSTPTRDSDGRVSNLKERITGINTATAQFESCEELDDVAREVISTALNVANSDCPRDLLRIASWLRNDMNIRLTPQVLLVLASQNENTKPFVAEFASKIIVRPDEVKTCYLLHRFLFGHKCLSASLNRAMGVAMSGFSERALIKYDSDSFPTWKNVLGTIKRKAGFPLSKEMSDYFVTGKVSKTGTPLAYSRKQLSKCKKFDEKAQLLAKVSMVNWEVLVTQFGSTQEVWTYLLDNELVGYMAMLRNLRNFLKADISMDAVKRVASFLSNKEQVLRSKQLPFRFLSAHRIIGEMYEMDSLKRTKLLDAIDDAMGHSIENVPVIEGLTVVFSDTSGSMGSPVSGKSVITCLDAGSLLASMVAKRATDAYVGAFATNPAIITAHKSDSILTIAEKIRRGKVNGHGTDAHKCVDWIVSKGIKPARVIIFSDMQMYNSDGGRSRMWGTTGSLADKWDSFKKTPNGKDCWLHTVDLAGMGDTPVMGSKHVNRTAGFSEKILAQLIAVETNYQSVEAKRAKLEDLSGSVPSSSMTIELIREMYE